MWKIPHFGFRAIFTLNSKPVNIKIVYKDNDNACMKYLLLYLIDVGDISVAELLCNLPELDIIICLGKWCVFYKASCYTCILQLKCCSKSEAGCCSEHSNSTLKNCPCSSCLEKLSDKINYGFKLTGGIGLFFSFTEVSMVE